MLARLGVPVQVSGVGVVRGVALVGGIDGGWVTGGWQRYGGVVCW